MSEKFDGTKPMVQLVPPEAILAMAEVFTFGCEKYGANNWRTAPFISSTRYYGAAQRHLLAWARGYDKDDESGKDHLVHALCCLAMLWTNLQDAPTADAMDDRWCCERRALAAAVKTTAKATAAYLPSPPKVHWVCDECKQTLTCHRLVHACPGPPVTALPDEVR